MHIYYVCVPYCQYICIWQNNKSKYTRANIVINREQLRAFSQKSRMRQYPLHCSKSM